MSKAKTDAAMAYYLTDHVCKTCFSRVVAHVMFDRRRVYRCTGCGAEAEGESEAALCACGIRLKDGRDAGIRCRHNDERSPENPFEIVAEHVG
jgi:DNA-directed RNA polymerase subunit RPC12/RpoP